MARAAARRAAASNRTEVVAGIAMPKGMRTGTAATATNVRARSNTFNGNGCILAAVVAVPAVTVMSCDRANSMAACEGENVVRLNASTTSNPQTTDKALRSDAVPIGLCTSPGTG